MCSYHVIRPWESRLFRQCRRAWDLGSRARQDYEPAEPQQVFDLDEAVRDALDVYYFPGMWEWNRAIVRPQAVEGFRKSMRRQRDAFTQHREPTAAQHDEWERQLRLGTDLLERYFSWVQPLDRFTPLQVATQFDVTVPDPQSPDFGLTAADGWGIRYRVRIGMAVIDEHDLHWLVEHRVVDSAWTSLDELLLDEQSLTRCWAWQSEFLAPIEGTIHTELRTGVPDGTVDGTDVQVVDTPGGFVTQQHSASFRRTAIPRSPTELERRGLDIARETREMTDPTLRVYPNPSWPHCSVCAYREPCLAMMQGVDERPILAASYRKRTAEDFEPGRLGSVWGFVPAVHRVAEHRSPGCDRD